MSELTVLNAQLRSDLGKGASRRLRHNNSFPAIIYGGKKAPKSITLQHNTFMHALEDESFYSSVFAIDIDGKQEKVILKDLQRHPFKREVLHADLQRVSLTASITKSVPLHFINEDTAVGVKAGGKISHLMSEIEIKCQAKNLPSSIDLDIQTLEIESTLHLSDIKLPKGVELTTDISDSSHNHPVLSIHAPKQSGSDDDTASEADVASTDD